MSVITILECEIDDLRREIQELTEQVSIASAIPEGYIKVVDALRRYEKLAPWEGVDELTECFRLLKELDRKEEEAHA